MPDESRRRNKSVPVLQGMVCQSPVAAGKATSRRRYKVVRHCSLENYGQFRQLASRRSGIFRAPKQSPQK